MPGQSYTGVAGNVSLSTAAQITEPADGDNDNAATFTVGFSKLTDYIEALRLFLTTAFAEDFEAATFPPTARPGWATPSPRFGTDSAWVRTTTNPIAGTASASAPVPQTLSTNSSLGLTLNFTTPSRISFLFALNCNNNQGDHLDFFVDGVLTMQTSTITSNTLTGSRFVTDLLSPGQHTFDWRFVRGGSASVGSEECKIDTVEVFAEETWRGDPTRLFLFDDGFLAPSSAATIGAATDTAGIWRFVTGANAGSYNSIGASSPPTAVGAFKITCAGVAINDWASAVVQMSSAAPATQLAFTEFRLAIPVLSANEIVEVGWVDTGTPPGTTMVGWAWDGSNGAASTWRWRTVIASAVTTADSNVAVTANAMMRFGTTIATVRGVTGAMFMKDGKALPGAASIPPYMVAPTATALPGVRVRSVTAANASNTIVDWMRLLMLRP